MGGGKGCWVGGGKGYWRGGEGEGYQIWIDMWPLTRTHFLVKFIEVFKVPIKPVPLFSTQMKQQSDGCHNWSILDHWNGDKSKTQLVLYLSSWREKIAEYYQKYFQDAADKGLLELSVTTANESNPKWNLCNMVCCAMIMIYVSFRISWYFGEMDRLHAQIPLYPNYWS